MRLWCINATKPEFFPGLSDQLTELTIQRKYSLEVLSRLLVSVAGISSLLYHFSNELHQYSCHESMEPTGAFFQKDGRWINLPNKEKICSLPTSGFISYGAGLTACIASAGIVYIEKLRQYYAEKSALQSLQVSLLSMSTTFVEISNKKSSWFSWCEFDSPAHVVLINYQYAQHNYLVKCSLYGRDDIFSIGRAYFVMRQLINNYLAVNSEHTEMLNSLILHIEKMGDKSYFLSQTTNYLVKLGAFSQENSTLPEVLEELTCKICYEYAYQPVIIVDVNQYGRILCQNCIERWIESQWKQEVESQLAQQILRGQAIPLDASALFAEMQVTEPSARQEINSYAMLPNCNSEILAHKFRRVSDTKTMLKLIQYVQEVVKKHPCPPNLEGQYESVIRELTYVQSILILLPDNQQAYAQT